MNYQDKFDQMMNSPITRLDKITNKVSKKEETMKQDEQIIKHIKKHGNITSFEAFNHYGMTRLAARIYDLREKGHKITTTPTTKNNKTFAVYSLNT